MVALTRNMISLGVMVTLSISNDFVFYSTLYLPQVRGNLLVLGFLSFLLLLVVSLSLPNYGIIANVSFFWLLISCGFHLFLSRRGVLLNKSLKIVDWCLIFFVSLFKDRLLSMFLGIDLIVEVSFGRVVELVRL